jgi:signal transduction histidine kinase
LGDNRVSFIHVGSSCMASESRSKALWRYGWEPPIDTRVLQSLPLGVAFFVAYVLLDRVSFIHPLQALNVTPWNPQPALAVALMVLYGRTWIPWVFVTVLAAEFLVRPLGVALGHAALFSAILACGYGAIAWLLRGPFAIAVDLTSRKDVLHLAAAVVAGAGITGLVYVTALGASGFVPSGEYLQVLFCFWVGDSIGMLVTLPLLLLLADSGRRSELAALFKRREVLVQIAVTAVLLGLVLAMDELERFKFFYLLFLPLVWIAARHGLVAAIGAVAVIQAGIIVAVVVQNNETMTILELQILLAALVLTGLLLGVTVDEWRFASNRLARTQQLALASEMATALAHELNQPLTALSTYADAIRLLAAKEGSASSALVDAAERIQRVATRSVDIVGRLRGVGGGCRRSAERMSVEEPLGAALAETGERATRLGVTIEVKQTAQLPPLTLDRDRMALVFQNLLGNALDAIEDCADCQRSIAIVLALEPGRYLGVTISDSGPGVRPQLAEKIFQPFYSGKAHGMGLGLAVSRSIVESHGGRLWAQPGSRGVFRIRLPL